MEDEVDILDDGAIPVEELDYVPTPNIENQVDPDEEEPAGEVTIGGVKYTTDEALALIEAGRDPHGKYRGAEQKFLEAKQLREDPELQTALQLSGILKTMDEDDVKFVLSKIGERSQQKATVGTIKIPDVQLPDGLSVEDLSQGEKAIFNAMSAQNQALARSLEMVTEKLAHVAGFTEQQQQESKLSQDAVRIAKELGVEGGIKPEDLRSAMQATGITDPKGAFLTHNWSDIAKGLVLAGKESAKTPVGLPNGRGAGFTGVSGGKGENGKPLTADQRMRLMMEGSVPSKA